MSSSRLAATLLGLFLLAPGLHAAGAKPLKAVSAHASDARVTHPAANAIDGNPADSSRWVTQSDKPPHWIEVRLDGVHDLAGLHLYSGYDGQRPVHDFVVQFWRDGAWVDIPSANVTGNKRPRLALTFDDTVRVRTDRIRLFITAAEDGTARVGEIVVWPLSAAGVPPLVSPEHTTPALVFLNQSGFNTGAPKRFTAPLAADGTRFDIFPASAASTAPAVFSGTVTHHIGDFSNFEPDTDREYVVQVGEHRSVPFRIADWWLERVTYQRAVDFMIDSRHYVGNDRRLCRGSFGWRDDHHFGWQLHTLVPQWLSNPSAYARMPRQVIYEAPANPKLWGRLAPPHADAPDIIKLIHWGADIIVTQNTTHELMKSQLAYFLYAWPWMKDHLPAQNYEVIRDYAFSVWTLPTIDQGYPYDESPEHNLLALKTKVGSTKGGYPPGFSIQPNLLMHAVALREGRADASLYLDAAVRQAAWIVDHLDWNDPLNTKGQRMSEFITVTGLSHLLSAHPDRAPAGLRAKLHAWAEVFIRRSENLWDFRKLGDAPDQWTPMGDRPTMWNEPGNVVGVPAIVFSVLPHLDDHAQKARLEQIAWAHFDSLFGRNPTGRHFSYDAPRELKGVEHGWYNFHVGGIGRLEETRFVIDGSPKNQHFPFNPEIGNIGWTEGWVQHNTPFNLSLAYLARHTSSLQLIREGDELIVRLEAPLNFDPAAVESATVVLTTSTGQTRELTLREEGPDSRFLSGRIPFSPAPGLSVTATYGFGYLATTASLGTPPATAPQSAATPALASPLPDFPRLIQPLREHSVFSDPDFNIWCGSVVEGDDGKFHMFYSRWPLSTGHLAWASHSEVARAVSDSPYGPFKHVEVVLPERDAKYWDGKCTHNPTVVRIGEKFYLYYMGNTGDRALSNGLNWQHRNNQRIGVAVADRPEGPWTRFDQPLIDISPDPQAPDALVTTNPSVAVRPDGGVLMIYKAVAKRGAMPFGGPVVHLAATADSPLGPFTKQPRQIFTGNGQFFAAEDPFIWHDGTRYLAIVKDMHGHFTGVNPSLALFTSQDGLTDWQPAPNPLVAGLRVTRPDGSTWDLKKLERPQLLFREGRPVVLYCAAADTPDLSASVNLAIPLQP